MRNAIIPGFVIVLSAVLVTNKPGDAAPPARNSAGTPAGNGAKGVHCTMIADAPRKDSNADRIVASGRFRCDQPGADAIGMIISLQKQGANGQWATVVQGQFNAGGADTTRDRSEADRTRSVTMACADGTYRTVVEGVSASKGSNGANVQKKHSSTTSGTNNPCSRRR